MKNDEKAFIYAVFRSFFELVFKLIYYVLKSIVQKERQAIAVSSFLPQRPIDESQMEVVFNCMENGRFSVAFQILNDLKSTGRPDILFALGVCLFTAGECVSAAGYFEQSLVALKGTRADSVSVPKTETYRTLRKREIAKQVYLRPFRFCFAESFFEITKENIVITLAEAFVGCGNSEKAKTLINSLSGEEFSDIKTRINAL